MIGIPEKLVDFRVYEDGSDLLGIADVKLPSFEPITETIKGAGVAGEVDSPTNGQYKSLGVTFNWRTMTDSLFELLKVKTHRLDCYGAIQVFNPATGAYKDVPAKVTMRCLPKKGESGKMESAAKQDSSSEMEIIYVKVTIDNKDVFELDKYNYVLKINGEDQLADLRAALGLS